MEASESNASEIARWREDSAIERWLAKRADASEFWKGVYVGYYKRRNPNYYAVGLGIIEKQSKVFGRQGVGGGLNEALVRDMVYSLHRFGCMYDEYFLFGFENLNAKGRAAFVTDKGRWSVYRRLNGRANLDVFNDKYKTYETFRKYYRREIVQIRVASDKEAFRRFCARHESFMVKPSSACVGRGIRLVSVLSSDLEAQDELFENLLAGEGMVLEEVVIQSESMAVLHRASVNTVRVPAVRCGSGVRILTPFLRMGRNGSVVDNGGAGGIFANVDEASGIVVTPGRDESGGRYIRHPDTGVVIPGFQVPRWDELLMLVEELASVLEGVRYIGWDLALTDGGWVVIEGNDNGQLLNQMADGCGRMKQFEEMVDDE